jgi:hypothetical protein
VSIGNPTNGLNMSTLYSVTCNTVETLDNATISRQTPTFILNGNILGFLDEKGAEEVAKRICNPTDNPNIEVNACAVKWIEIE